MSASVLPYGLEKPELRRNVPKKQPNGSPTWFINRTLYRNVNHDDAVPYDENVSEDDVPTWQRDLVVGYINSVDLFALKPWAQRPWVQQYIRSLDDPQIRRGWSDAIPNANLRATFLQSCDTLQSLL